jgi:hypothetical protein
MFIPSSWSHFRAIDFGATLKQILWIPKPLWTVDEIPDLTGKVVIVTGGNTGIGKETAKVRINHSAAFNLNLRGSSEMFCAGFAGS